MRAHKTRATARTESGDEVILFYETIASQVKCGMMKEGEDGPFETEVGLDELLNHYAEEINQNAEDIREIELNIDAESHQRIAALEDKVGELELTIGPAISENPFAVTFDTLTGKTVVGVWNNTLKRVEF